MQDVTYNIGVQTIAAKVWGEPGKEPMLALHGWLDNAASFDHLAPLLDQYYIVAVDLPGHGYSSHKAIGHYIHIIDYVIDMIDLVKNQLNWTHFSLLGHSLGGAIACLMAGTLPEAINNILVVDGLGPMTTPAAHTPMQLRLHLQETLSKPKSRVPIYQDIDMAAKARMQANLMALSSARTIVARGLKQLADGHYSWRTDPRLLKPSALHLTEEQTLAFLAEITAPMLVVRPEPGFPFPEQVIKRRIAAIHNLRIESLPGQHHVHLDKAEAVAQIIKRFVN